MWFENTEVCQFKQSLNAVPPNFRNAEPFNSSVNNRAIDSDDQYESLSDGFHDLYDALDELENNLANNSTSSFAPIVPSPSLGDLLRINLT